MTEVSAEPSPQAFVSSLVLGRLLLESTFATISHCTSFIQERRNSGCLFAVFLRLIQICDPSHKAKKSTPLVAKHGYGLGEVTKDKRNLDNQMRLKILAEESRLGLRHRS